MRKNKLGIVMPVLWTREYTDKILPQIWDEIDMYLYDVPVKFVLMDSGGHEDYEDIENHPELKELMGDCEFEFEYVYLTIRPICTDASKKPLLAMAGFEISCYNKAAKDF